MASSTCVHAVLVLEREILRHAYACSGPGKYDDWKLPLQHPSVPAVGDHHIWFTGIMLLSHSLQLQQTLPAVLLRSNFGESSQLYGPICDPCKTRLSRRETCIDHNQYCRPSASAGKHSVCVTRDRTEIPRPSESKPEPTTIHNVGHSRYQHTC